MTTRRRTPVRFGVTLAATAAIGLVATAGRTVDPPVVDPPLSGEIHGTVTFEGAASDGGMRIIDMRADAYCAAQHLAGAIVDRPIRVDADGQLRNVLIYVKHGLPEGAEYPVPTEPAVLDQDECMYEPHTLAMQVGQTLLIRNSDLAMHNVHVAPRLNRAFNIGQPTKGFESERTFTKAEIGIEVGCDVHDWMHAFLAVFDHPFYAVTGFDGSFSLRGLPPGEYVIAAWHETLGTLERTVVVEEDGSAQVWFAFGERPEA